MRRIRLGDTRIVAVFTAALVGGFGVAALASRSASEAVTPAQNITGNQTLVAGQELESSGGQYVVELASNGNLEELYYGGRVLWATTNGVPGDHALLQPNGNLVLLNSAGQTLWSSNTTGAGCPTLDLQRDGNLVIYDTKAVFATGQLSTLHGGMELRAGFDVWSPNGRYVLAMQGDGNLVVYNDASKPLWSSKTSGNPGAWAAMQTDGNLVVYSAANKALWSSATSGNPGAWLAMQSDGNLVVYSAANKALWASNTSGAANNGVDIDPHGPAASATPCPAAPPPPPPPPPTVTSVTTVTTTTATVETVPVPVKPRHVRVRVTVKWRWHGPITRMERLTIGRMPRHADFLAFYRKRHGRDRRQVREASNRREVRSMIRWLEGRRYRVGDRLSIKFTRRGYLPERAQFRFRDGKLPELAR